MMNFLTPNVTNLQDPAELQANQRGEITEAQNARLTASVGFQGGCATLVVVFVAFQFLFFLSFFLASFLGAIGFLFAGIFILLTVFLLARFGGLWQIWQRWNALKQDRENRAIRQGQGNLAFEKDNYIVQAAGRTLLLPASNNACGLQPGATYHFYYLDESGFVLSAEELYPASPAQVRNSLMGILLNANKFSQEDLELNRNAEVSPAQRMKALPNLFVGILFGAVPLGMGLLFFTSNRDAGGDFLSLLVPAIFLAVFGLVGGFMFFNALLDLLAQTPLVTEGAGHKEKRTSGGKNRRTVYYYVVDGVSFQVSRAAYQALLDGESYRVYALPRTKKLLTIEPL